MTVTKAMLEKLILHLNTITGSPTEEYTKIACSERGAEGPNQFRHNAECFYLAGAYGGYKLERSLRRGGSTDITSGYVSKRELMEQIRGILTGYRIAVNKDFEARYWGK